MIMRMADGCWSGWRKMLCSLTGALAAVMLFAFVGKTAQGSVEVGIDHSGLSAAATSSQITYMELRVSAPTGEIIFTGNSDGTPLYWHIPATAPDGLYSWEVRIGRAILQNARMQEQEEGDTRTGGGSSKAEVESGGFLIENGIIVPPSAEETTLLDAVLEKGSQALQAFLDFLVTPALADQAINDDLIVTGSECVGFDCVNGENFGFDTIRIKENNTRIKFMDTSSGSFPSNDWELTANDSNNGGKNIFAIQDVDAARRLFILEAGAPANSIYLRNNGNIGLGTSVPVLELHIADGDTPAIRLDQDGTGGWGTQVWDVAGNETNFFVRDVTNGSKIPFKIKPNAPDDSFYLSSSGNVGLGTATPVQTLHVQGNAFISGNLELGSSREIKENIRSLEAEDALQTFAGLRPVRFNYKAAPEEESIGFIAEEVPELVATNSHKSISTMDVVAVMAKVVQEQQKAIEELNAMVLQLGAQLEAQTVAGQVAIGR